MTLLWALQLLIDIAFGATLLLFWWWRRGTESTFDRNRAEQLIVELERKSSELDELLRTRRELTTQALTKLSRICDEAGAILERTRWQGDLYGPSVEENELKAALGRQSGTAEEPPALSQMHRAQKRVQNEGGIDLKAILQEQLA